MSNRNVTVIIPVYKDWNSLKLCIESLKKYLNNRHTVLLINDISKDANAIEANILNAIKDERNFFYFRNPSNLGFVKTCNKAVFEYDKTNNDILLLNSDTEVTENFLEEMLEVLHAHEKHGIVSPRSNNSSLLSVPFNFKGDKSKVIDKSYECYKEIKDLLPESYVIPTATGFCMLIKRSLIDNFGLFDEVYEKGYQEENDFCMRVNKYGYSALMANRAFVFHYETKSFDKEEKIKRQKKNELILHDRYPHYPGLIYSYFTKDIHPVDYFADVISEKFYKKKKILFSLYGIPQAFNGTSKYALNTLKSFVELFSDKYEIHILTHKDADEFYGLSQKYSNVCYPETIQANYHLAYVPFQIFHLEHLAILNKHALKIASCILDIISLRSGYLIVSTTEPIKEIISLNLMYNDGISTISEFSQEDIKDYFNKNLKIENYPKMKVLYCGVEDFEKEGDEKFVKPFDEYVLVIGNKHFYHKSLFDTFNLIVNSKSPNNFVFIGLDENIDNAHNTKTYSGGNLSNDFVQFLYQNCNAVLFPSQYEGFGIPLLEAYQAQKPMILFDNQINHEVVNNVTPDYSKYVTYFSTFSQLQKIIESKIETKVVKIGALRTWKQTAEETEEFINDLLEEKIDTKKLEQRWFALNLVANYAQPMFIERQLTLKDILESLSIKLGNENKLLAIPINLLLATIPIARFVTHFPQKVKSKLKYMPNKSYIYENNTNLFNNSIHYEIEESRIDNEKIELTGWIFDSAKKVQKVDVIGVYKNMQLKFQIEISNREDILQKYINYHSLNSGFKATADNSNKLNAHQISLYFVLTYTDDIKIVPIKSESLFV